MPDQETQTPPASSSNMNFCGVGGGVGDLQLFSNGNSEGNEYERDDKSGEDEVGMTSTEKMEEIEKSLDQCWSAFLVALRLD